MNKIICLELTLKYTVKTFTLLTSQLSLSAVPSRNKKTLV